MFWFLYFVLPVLIIAPLVWLAFEVDKRSSWNSDWDLVFGLIAITAVVCGLIYYLVVIGVSTARHFDRASCHSYAAKTGRPTKFVRYPGWSTDCLTPAHDGKWVPTDQIGDYNK